MDDREIVKTGFDELDKKFENEGFPAGLICNVDTDPKSPSLSFLLQVYQNKNKQQKSHYISPLLSRDKIVQAITDLDTHPDVAENIASRSDVETMTDIVEHLFEQSFEGGEVVILHGASSIRPGDMTHRDIHCKMQEIVVENNVLLIVHTETNSETEYDTIIRQTADYILTLRHNATRQSVNNSVVIERTPPGHQIRDIHKDDRKMEVSDTGERVEISTGGTI